MILIILPIALFLFTALDLFIFYKLPYVKQVKYVDAYWFTWIGSGFVIWFKEYYG